MSHISFDNYRRLAQLSNVNDTEVSGRYAFQAEAERRILFDVLVKLDLKVSDTLLEIGCGPGILLVPLSYFCAEATGIDNESAIERLKSRSNKSINCISGNFLEISMPINSFDKILVYSVLHYLSNRDEVLTFIQRALSLLKPGGRMLLGDFPNISKKSRFIASRTGREIAENWDERIRDSIHLNNEMPIDSDLVSFDDAFLFEIMIFVRKKGFESFLLPQPLDLPFGGSREDILIVAHR